MNKDAVILVVDDEPDITEIICDQLLANGFKHVLETTDGQKALQMVEDHNVELVITDVRMPEISGLELCKRVKEKNNHVQVIFVTGFADISDQDALNMGVFEILGKPIRFSRLEKVIGNCLASPDERIQPLLSLSSETSTLRLNSQESQRVKWGYRGLFMPLPSGFLVGGMGEEIQFEFVSGKQKITGRGTIRWKDLKFGEDTSGSIGVVVEGFEESCYNFGIQQMSQRDLVSAIPES